MRASTVRIAAVVAAAALAASSQAQTWEVGAGGGMSLYQDNSVRNGSLEGVAGFADGYAITAYLGQNQYRFIGGEVRYTLTNNGAEVKAGSAIASMASRQHAITYNFTGHFTPREQRLRPFVLAGAGVKRFEASGVTRANQPLNTLVLLTDTSETKPVVTFGAGVKLRLGQRLVLRGEVIDYYSPVPTRILNPAAGAQGGAGWIHGLVPLVSIGFNL